MTRQRATTAGSEYSEHQANLLLVDVGWLERAAVPLPHPAVLFVAWIEHSLQKLHEAMCAAPHLPAERGGHRRRTRGIRYRRRRRGPPPRSRRVASRRRSRTRKGHAVVMHALLTPPPPRNPASSMSYRAVRHRTRAPTNSLRPDPSAEAVEGCRMTAGTQCRPAVGRSVALARGPAKLFRPQVRTATPKSAVPCSPNKSTRSTRSRRKSPIRIPTYRVLPQPASGWSTPVLSS